MKVLITGGSRGIGKAIAIELLKDKHDVLVLSKTTASAKAAERELSRGAQSQVTSIGCDLSSKRSIQKLLSACVQRKFLPEVLVLNAGIFLEGTLLQSTDDSYERTMMVNLNSTYYVVKQFLTLIQKKTLKKIFIVGSTAALEPYPVGALYGVAKWGLRGYATNLRHELMNYGTAVTFLLPGGTLTDLWEGEKLPPKRLLEPSDIGKLVRCFLTLSDQAVVENVTIRPVLGDMH